MTEDQIKSWAAMYIKGLPKAFDIAEILGDHDFTDHFTKEDAMTVLEYMAKAKVEVTWDE